MCGIIGYVGKQQAPRILLDGLTRLEYRGYDSAGIAVVNEAGQLTIRKTAGMLRNLIDAVAEELPDGQTGLGHTRWATHGNPTDLNAHPHTDCSNQVVVVHNGIVENCADLRAKLTADGHKFTSDTDTEVIPHLIEAALSQGSSFEEASRAAVQQLRGANAVAATWSHQPGQLLGIRHGNAGGIAVGYGHDEMFLASDLPALIPLTNQIAFLAPGEVALISSTKVTFMDLDGRPITKMPRTTAYSHVATEKGTYKHFMHKEIMEQPESVANALRGRTSAHSKSILLDEVPLTEQEIRSLSRVVFVGMGTSFHAAHAGQLMMERLTGIPSSVENSAEFRYREPVLDRQTLVVSIGQSGETADTLAAMEETQRMGAKNVTICNIEDSQATRLADGTMFMRAGLEIGVASTKTFVNSMTCLYLLATHIGLHRKFIGTTTLKESIQALSKLPEQIGHVLSQSDGCHAIAQLYSRRNNFLYIGRGIQVPIAMEGALKLKEISYIHAEGTSAGELKHGPIALVDPTIPVVAMCLQDSFYHKMLGNISEVKARGGVVVAVATHGDTRIKDMADHVLYIPEVPYLLSPIVSVIPLQLLAYNIAILRGCDVDQPRNLAKSVTVE